MRLRVIPPDSLITLPECLLVYEIQYDSSFYQKKSKPFSKVSMPRGYTQNQALSQQFGIQPHTLFCMDYTLWRQQIVETITFDLSTDYVTIAFINNTCSHHSFAECEKLFKKKDRSGLDSRCSAQGALGSSLPGTFSRCPAESRIKSTILNQLEHLNKTCLACQNTNTPSSPDYVALVSAMTQSELSGLRRSTRPLPLMPTAQQQFKELNRSLYRADNSISSQRPRAKKRRVPSLRVTKKRKHSKQTGAAAVSESEDESKKIKPSVAIDLPPPEVYELVSVLSRFRSALVDLFQTTILSLLKATLPLTYPLWVIQAELDHVRQQFGSHAQHFTQILQDSASLEKFRKRAENEKQIVPIDDLEDWCFSVAGAARAVTAGNEAGTSADTSLEEPAPSTLEHQMRQTMNQDPFEDCTSSLEHSLGLSWVDLQGKEALDRLDKFASPYHMSGLQKIYASISKPQIFTPTHHIPVVRRAHDQAGRIEQPLRDSTPPLSPITRLSDPFSHPGPLASNDRLFQFPILALQPALLCTISPQLDRDLAIELSIQLAENRLLIGALEATSQTLSLLEEERVEKDRLSGLDRFSDVITTSRLTGGWGEGHAIDGAQDVAIAAALAAVKARAKSFADDLLRQKEAGLTQLRAPPVLPNKQSEAKRRATAKRRTWLAVTRRLERPWITPLAFGEPEPVWPEPIFLKAFKTDRRKHEKKSKRRRLSTVEEPPTTQVLWDSASGAAAGRDGTESFCAGLLSTSNEAAERCEKVRKLELASSRGYHGLSAHHLGVDEVVAEMKLDESEASCSDSKSFKFLVCEGTQSPDSGESLNLTSPHAELEAIIKNLQGRPAFDDDEKEQASLSEVDSEWPESPSPAGHLTMLVEI